MWGGRLRPPGALWSSKSKVCVLNRFAENLPEPNHLTVEEVHLYRSVVHAYPWAWAEATCRERGRDLLLHSGIFLLTCHPGNTHPNGHRHTQSQSWGQDALVKLFKLTPNLLCLAETYDSPRKMLETHLPEYPFSVHLACLPQVSFLAFHRAHTWCLWAATPLAPEVEVVCGSQEGPGDQVCSRGEGPESDP